MTDASQSENQAIDADAASESRQHRRNLVWLIIHCIVYLPLRIWCRTRVIGHENIDPDRGGILLINHQSYLDPLFVAVRLTRPVSYLARDSLFKVPFIGWVCRNTYVIPISRTAFRGSSIRKALDRLETGFLVSIYPQGTRCAGAPEEFRPGFLSLVRRSDAPVYPVAIVGADKAMPKGAWFIRPKTVTVVYGAALSPEERESLCSLGDDKQAAALACSKVRALYESVENKPKGIG